MNGDECVFTLKSDALPAPPACMKGLAHKRRARRASRAVLEQLRDPDNAFLPPLGVPTDPRNPIAFLEFRASGGSAANSSVRAMRSHRS